MSFRVCTSPNRSPHSWPITLLFCTVRIQHSRHSCQLNKKAGYRIRVAQPCGWCYSPDPSGRQGWFLIRKAGPTWAASAMADRALELWTDPSWFWEVSGTMLLTPGHSPRPHSFPLQVLTHWETAMKGQGMTFQNHKHLFKKIKILPISQNMKLKQLLCSSSLCLEFFILFVVLRASCCHVCSCFICVHSWVGRTGMYSLRLDADTITYPPQHDK